MIKFKIRNPALEEELLREVNAIEYDDCTYYVSQRLNNGCKFKHALFDNYNNLFVRYTKIQNDKIYKQYIEQYEQLKRDERLIKEVNV